MPAAAPQRRGQPYSSHPKIVPLELRAEQEHKHPPRTEPVKRLTRGRCGAPTHICEQNAEAQGPPRVAYLLVIYILKLRDAQKKKKKKSRARTQASAEDRASKTTDSGEVWGSNPYLRTERRGTRPPPLDGMSMADPSFVAPQ